ncbi:Protein of unknown function, partial [Gryllus bimaculatus]
MNEVNIHLRLCLIKHESSFNTAATNVNTNGSKDNGIFQLFATQTSVMTSNVRSLSTVDRVLMLGMGGKTTARERNSPLQPTARIPCPFCGKKKRQTKPKHFKKLPTLMPKYLKITKLMVDEFEYTIPLYNLEHYYVNHKPHYDS